MAWYMPRSAKVLQMKEWLHMWGSLVSSQPDTVLDTNKGSFSLHLLQSTC
jgi:hypothetical protein